MFNENVAILLTNELNRLNGMLWLHHAITTDKLYQIRKSKVFDKISIKKKTRCLLHYNHILSQHTYIENGIALFHLCSV